MKRRTRWLSMLLIVGLIFTAGCGTGTVQKKSPDAAGTETVAEDSGDGGAAAADAQEDMEPISEVGKLQIDRVKFTAKKPLKYNDWEIEVLGFEEKKKIVTESYTDKAEDGKVYLILYLKMHNSSDADYYFAPDHLVTKVDGKKVETTYLINSPHGYDTLYRTYESKELSAGFLVWEVPEGWQKLKMVYHGFETDYFMTPVLKLKRSDLFEPEEYDPVYLT